MHSDRRIVNLALIGFMGAGKTSVGRLVADQLHFDYLDSDELIQSRTGRSIAEIFKTDGEPAFRALESQMVGELTSRTKTVIATGGGLPLNPANLASLKTHALVVCLWASPEKIWERVRNQTHRPLLHDLDPQKKDPRPARRAGTILQAGRRAGEHGHPITPRSRPACGPSVPA